ncbi:MAG: hypothetical protein IPN15_19120 [Saprospiraceae bacterium]|nr:hypothetical protein [Candidatus Vicinibacter affinis]
MNKKADAPLLVAVCNCDAIRLKHFQCGLLTKFLINQMYTINVLAPKIIKNNTGF